MFDSEKVGCPSPGESVRCTLLHRDYLGYRVLVNDDPELPGFLVTRYLLFLDNQVDAIVSNFRNDGIVLLLADEKKFKNNPLAKQSDVLQRITIREGSVVQATVKCSPSPHLKQSGISLEELRVRISEKWNSANFRLDKSNSATGHAKADVLVRFNIENDRYALAMNKATAIAILDHAVINVVREIISNCPIELTTKEDYFGVTFDFTWRKETEDQVL